MTEKEQPRLGTLAVWGGEEEYLLQGATQVPIVHSVAFGYEIVDEWLEVARGERPGHIYSRNTNPTVHAFEEKVRLLEGAEAATSFATGMAAISNTLFTLLSPGDRVVSIKDSYGGTSKLFIEFLPRFQIEAYALRYERPRAPSRPRSPKAARCLSGNPDQSHAQGGGPGAAGRGGAPRGRSRVVDNTFATPINQNPLELGADLVLHSATKFLGGHADALGGVVCGAPELVEHIYHYREITGATLDPMAAYLLLRGMKTLHLRIRQQNESALQHRPIPGDPPAVSAVFYPGLESHSTTTSRAARCAASAAC